MLHGQCLLFEPRRLQEKCNNCCTFEMVSGFVGTIALVSGGGVVVVVVVVVVIVILIACAIASRVIAIDHVLLRLMDYGRSGQENNNNKATTMIITVIMFR